MMTELQTVVLDELRMHDCPWIADAAERFRKQNRRYYIDARVRCPRWLRRLFVKANSHTKRKGDRP